MLLLPPKIVPNIDEYIIGLPGITSKAVNNVMVAMLKPKLTTAKIVALGLSVKTW